jgi:hypothetical protein
MAKWLILCLILSSWAFFLYRIFYGIFVWFSVCWFRGISRGICLWGSKLDRFLLMSLLMISNPQTPWIAEICNSFPCPKFILFFSLFLDSAWLCEFGDLSFSIMFTHEVNYYPQNLTPIHYSSWDINSFQVNLTCRKSESYGFGNLVLIFEAIFGGKGYLC